MPPPKIAKKHNIPTVLHLHGSEFKKYYDECSDNKRKAMIASSNYLRCCELLEKNVFPLIKERVPEFTLYYCGYSEKFTSEHNITDDDNGKIIDLGCIDKKTLSEYQKKCSVWG